MAPLWLHTLTPNTVEKRKPTYDLDSIKAAFATVSTLRIAATARRDANALGLVMADVHAIVQRLTRADFYKSMTTYAASSVWQDVYHARAPGLVLYVKFTADPEGYFLISFKAK